MNSAVVTIQPIKHVVFGAALDWHDSLWERPHVLRPAASNQDVGIAATDGYQHAEQLPKNHK